jgi:hypothetical protein
MKNALPPIFLTTYSRYGRYRELTSYGAAAAPASQTWPVANLAIYVPFYLPFAYPVRRLAWVNGGTAAGNLDIGIYGMNGGRIVSSGSVAQAGTNTIQYLATVDKILRPGAYYFAATASSTSTRIFGFLSTAVRCRSIGVLQEATALPLPAQMTPAQYAQTLYPLFGFTLTPSGY